MKNYQGGFEIHNCTSKYFIISNGIFIEGGKEYILNEDIKIENKIPKGRLGYIYLDKDSKPLKPKFLQFSDAPKQTKNRGYRYNGHRLIGLIDNRIYG